MPYDLCLKPGTDTPSFIYAAGAQAFTTTITNPHRPNAGEAATLPVPWDPVYEREFSALIAALGRRYSSDPLCRSVVLTCANYLSAEMHLPKSPSDLRKWAALGDYGGKLYAVYVRYTKEWAQAFPKQAVTLHLSKVLNLPPDFCARIIEEGLKQYPERFTIQNCQLTGRREDTGMMSYNLVQQFRDRSQHGFQSLAGLSRPNERMGSIEMAVLNIVHAQGQYWELWREDGFDPQTCSAILRAWKEGQKLGYSGYKQKLITEGKYHP